MTTITDPLLIKQLAQTRGPISLSDPAGNLSSSRSGS